MLCFGYRMAVTVIQRGIRGFFSHIVGFVVKFILTEKIAKWIADQGGWVGSRDMIFRKGRSVGSKLLKDVLCG